MEVSEPTIRPIYMQRLVALIYRLNKRDDRKTLWALSIEMFDGEPDHRHNLCMVSIVSIQLLHGCFNNKEVPVGRRFILHDQIGPKGLEDELKHFDDIQM